MPKLTQVYRSILAVIASIADGADVTQGSTTDPATGSGANTTVIGALRAIRDKLLGSIAVTGTFWQATQPVKGTGFSIPVTLTVTNGAYTDKDVVGGLITLPGMFSAINKHSRITSVTLGGVVPIDYHLWFLTADIATPAADNAAFTLVAADLALVKGVVDLWSNVWRKAASAFYVATKDNVGIDVVAGAVDTSGRAYLVTDAATSPGTTTLQLVVSGEYID